MKKLFAVLVCLCMMVCAAAAEDVPELNWADIGTEEILAQGEFQQIETGDLPAVIYWIPSGLSSVDVSGEEGFFKPAALYMTEDQAYSVAVFAFEVAGLEEYAEMMKTQGGGSNFRNLVINGVGCICYEVESDNMECVVYPITENKILSFSFAPMNGDEDWDGTKAAIIASIQPAAE